MIMVCKENLHRLLSGGKQTYAIWFSHAPKTMHKRRGLSLREILVRFKVSRGYYSLDPTTLLARIYYFTSRQTIYNVFEKSLFNIQHSQLQLSSCQTVKAVPCTDFCICEVWLSHKVFITLLTRGSADHIRRET